ncbi:MAG: M20/M25/M40 family metallo-hydrolase [Planctomycetaceae bacterium]|nr:M20/M25/M40 family metallo-hydrolase [Planctomycetaceae bacterium]
MPYLKWIVVIGAVLALPLAAAWPVYPGDAVAESQQRLLDDIKYLSSDELEGRGVGLKGLDLAADYIRDQFAKAGLKLDAANGGPYQPFTMPTGAVLGPINTLEIVGPAAKKIEPKINDDFTPQSYGGAGAFSGELAFCGYGIDAADQNYNDFAGIELKGKVAVIMRKVPGQGASGGKFAGKGRGISTHAELRTKINNAFDKGAAAILFVNDPHTGRQELENGRKQVAKLAEGAADAAIELETADPADAEKYKASKEKLTTELARYKAGKGHLGSEEPDTLMKFGYAGSEVIRNLPIVHITRAVADQFLKPALGKSLTELEAAIDQEMKPHSALLPGWTAGGVLTIERTQAEVKNVIAVLEGTGPLADETIVIGAHYDHVGKGGAGSLLPGSTDVHNGADDNASGTVSLLELARRLAVRKDKLPRRIVFIAFTGEESGLIGSARYTREPVFPLEKTIAMLNMDMVGRLKDEKLTVFGTGTAPVWEGLLHALEKDSGLQMIFKPEGFGPSDHSSFYAKQIPVLHFFTGTHSDYHRPSDDWDKINVPGAERIVELIEKLIVKLAEDPERPKYLEVKGSAQISEREGARPYFGSIPDFGVELPGYALSGVAAGSPADKAGLKAGDRIVQLGMVKVENLEDFDLALRRFSPGDTVEVTVVRGQEKVTVKVTLDKPRG